MVRSSLEVTMAQGLQEAREQVLDDLGSPLAQRGFGPKDFAASYLVFEREYVPGISWFLTIILFPIGLLFFFLMRAKANLFFEFSAGQDVGTLLKIDGKAPRSVWRQIEGWRAAQAQPTG
jgi:hypothetical protein